MKGSSPFFPRNMLKRRILEKQKMLSQKKIIKFFRNIW